MRQKVDSFSNSFTKQRCSICQKQALFYCGKCESTQYCSREHQKKHWDQHKKVCALTSKGQSNLQSLMKKKFQIKKCFFENYSTKAFQACILDAKVLINLQRQYLAISKDPFGQFDYGAAICLAVKAQIQMGDKKHARLELQSYLIEKKEYLSDLHSISVFKKQKQTVIKQKDKQYLQRKVNLLSTIGNLCYALQMNCLQYYVLYTKHIQKAFGNDSYQASNCYFLVGCLFVQNGFFNRAIACFSRSAKLRGMYAGDCYFNIGVLYKMQNKLSKALQMFQIAMKLREQQYGQDANQIAQVYQNMGSIYVQLNDFKTAFNQYEKAFKIRSNDPYSMEYLNIIQQIQQLYHKLELYIETGQPDLKKPEIFTHLKDLIRQEKLYWPDDKTINSAQNNQQSLAELIKTSRKQKNKGQQKIQQIEQIQRPVSIAQRLFKLSNQLLSVLGPSQLFRLSELQMDLQNTQTQFEVVYTIANSAFLQILAKQRYQMLVEQNLKLFQLIKLQEMKSKIN